MTIAKNTSPTHIVHRLAQCFYEVVPSHYKTYCSFTSKITQIALTQLGIDCHQLPCQIWYSEPGHHYVVGFLGPNNPHHNPAKWDGHVVCCTETLLVDTATHHFQREFKLSAPDVAVASLFGISSTALAQLRLTETDALWWHEPPVNVDTRLPEEPLELAQQYAQALIARLKL